MSVASGMHVAQLNVATMRYDADDPRMVDFMNGLDAVNAIADRSPGFIWRLQTETGDATDVRFGEDPRLLVNLSVWETPEDLERFVFATVHRKFYMRRADWFEKATTPRFVMWPVVAGHRPTVDQAMARLDRLVTDGPSEDAFGWERIADLKLWLKKHCA